MGQGFLFLFLSAVALVPAHGHACDVTEFGAKGDGKTKDTAAIQKTIDECSARGGGIVYLPSGTYLSGTLRLRSRITLFISPGATLLGSTDPADFDPPHLVVADDVEQVAIEGGGTIQGQGRFFWTENFRPRPKRPGPYLVFNRCRQIRIENIHIYETPGWGIKPSECDGVLIRGVTMRSDLRGPNTDGIDPDSSRNVMISDCHIETGDDAICLKSHGGKPVEDVVVTNCVLKSDDSGFKLGTSGDGDFRRITVSNSVIFGSRYGLTMFIKDGPTVEGVSFSNIQIETAGRAEYPILIDLEKRTPQSRVGRIRDISFSDIRMTGAGRVLVSGMPESPLENLVFRNVSIRATGAPDVSQSHKPRGVSGMAPAAPELDFASVPAYYIFAHARSVTLRDIGVDTDLPTERHAVYAAGVERLTVDGLRAQKKGRLAVVGLVNTNASEVRAAWTEGEVHPHP